MSVLPEVVIQRALSDGIRAIRKDPRVIKVLFRSLPQVQQEAIKEFITKKTIDFSVNYPRKQSLKLPALVLLLKTEEEAQTFLGNHMGTSVSGLIPSSDISFDDVLGSGQHAGTVSDSSGLPKTVTQTMQVDTAVDFRITFDGDSAAELLDFVLSINQSNPGCLDLYVVSGPGEGQVKSIIRLTSNSIDIQDPFEVQLTDQSVVVIREASNPGASIGEPSSIYPSSSKSLSEEGVNYETQYQLSVLAGHQEEVLYLYAITKVVLLSTRSFLEEQGIMALKLSGSDFGIRPEYLPNEAFQRSLTLRFTYPFSFIKELETASAIELTIAPDDPNVPCPLNIGRIDI